MNCQKWPNFTRTTKIKSFGIVVSLDFISDGNPVTCSLAPIKRCGCERVYQKKFENANPVGENF
jgi:hypothetical protein